MKKRKKKRQSNLSAGTIFMLLLTGLVIIGCVWFMLSITGGDVRERAAEAMAAFSLIEPTATPEQGPRVVQTQRPAPTLAPTASPTATPQTTPEPVPEKTTITIAAAGTVYAPKAIRQTVEDASGDVDFAPVFDAVKGVLLPADLAIVTLETTTAGSEMGYGNYNTPPQILDALRSCGTDLVSLATERALDKDYDGLAITMQEITSRGLSYAGVYPEGYGAGAATMMRIGGMQVAVLGYSYGLSEEGKVKTETDSRGMLAMLDMERMHSDIAKARLDGANLVIVLPHWGTKNKQETPESVRRMAMQLAEAGADVILGTHPNVAQGIERITATRADGLMYETVVCYSLGSLLTDARAELNTAGMAVALDVTYDPAVRRVALGGVRVTPLYIAKTKSEDQMVYRVVPAENEAAVAALESAEQAAAQLAAQRIREITAQEVQP